MKQRLTVDLTRAALLCIDLQEEHRKDSRYLVAGFDVVLANIRRLQNSARASGVSVLHSAYVVNSAGEPVRPFHPMMPDGSSAFSDAANPLSEICFEVEPIGDETLMIKSDASSLAKGDMAKILHERGVDWLLVVGVWTEACIAATVKDAVELGFRAILVKDACSSGTVAMHETAVLNIANRLYGGAVTDTNGACRILAGEAIDAWQVQGSVPLRFGYNDAADTYRNL